MSDAHALAVRNLLARVRPLLLASARAVEAGSRPFGLTVGTRAVLEVLVDGGPLPVPVVARRLDLTRQAVQRHVDALRDRGLVTTAPNPDHRRSVLVVASPAGCRSLDDLRTAELTRLATLATDCSDADVSTAGRVLAALTRDVRARAAELSADPLPPDAACEPRTGAGR